MGLVNISRLLWPMPLDDAGGVASSNVTLDAASEKLAWIIPIHEALTITGVGFRTSTVTTGATLDVRIETVGTDGNPTGTLWATNTNGAKVIADTDDNLWVTTSLTASATVAVGDRIAVVVVNPAVSPGNLQILSGSNSWLFSNLPYVDTFLSGAWSKTRTCTGVALETSGGVYKHIPGVLPASSWTDQNFASNSNPDERGNRFEVPFKCRASGAWVSTHLTGGATGTYRAKLYDSGDNVIAETGSLDQDLLTSSSSICYLPFTSNVELDVGTLYRITLLPETTQSMRYQLFDVASAAIMGAFEGGTVVHATERTNAGAWTDTTTQRHQIGILIDQLHDGAGGGLITHPGMVGGMRG